MTGEEIDACRIELTKIIEKINGVQPDDKALLDELRKLASRVGACPWTTVVTSGIPLWGNAPMPELVYNIHQALQTASMIDACRTAAENTKLTADSVRLTEEALGEARKSQRWVVRTAWAAIATAVGTTGMAIAAWLALG